MESEHQPDESAEACRKAKDAGRSEESKEEMRYRSGTNELTLKGTTCPH